MWSGRIRSRLPAKALAPTFVSGTRSQGRQGKMDRQCQRGKCYQSGSDVPHVLECVKTERRGGILSTQPHRRQPIVLYRWRRTGQRKNFSRLKDRMARAVTDWIDTNKIVIWFIVIFSLSSMHTKHNSATQLKENALLYITPNELLSFFTTNCRKIVLHGALFRCR